jgi:hypothetical protein
MYPTADDIYGNENQRFFVTAFLKYHLNRKLLLFAMKINSVCRKMIPVHSEYASTGHGSLVLLYKSKYI